MENCCQFVFTITLTVGIHFRLNFSESRALEKKKTELPNHHVICTVCTLIEHSSPTNSAREIAQLFETEKRFLEQPRSQGPSASRRSRIREGERSGKEVVFGRFKQTYTNKVQS